MQNYLRILIDLSKKSQIFFTSFKTEVLGLKDMNMYLLQMEKPTGAVEKATRLHEIKEAEARELLTHIK